MIRRRPTSAWSGPWAATRPKLERQADETQPHASRGQALEPNTKTPARGLQVHCARLRRARGPTLTPASKLASVHSGSDVSTSSLDSSSTSTARHANSSSKSMAPSIDTSRARTPGEQESSKPVASTSLGSLRRPSSMKPKRSFCRWNARFTIDDSSVALANRPHPPAARPAFPRLGGRSPLSRHPPFWWQALLPFVKQNQGVTLPARRFAPDRGCRRQLVSIPTQRLNDTGATPWPPATAHRRPRARLVRVRP